jgi:ACDE family multidrug resistance protein
LRGSRPHGDALPAAVALIATLVLLDPTPKPARAAPLLAPLKALRHRGLLTLSITALLYNWGFFTMLGFAPFPMGLSAIQLGMVFFGWGILVAFFSVIGAPRLQARFGTARSLYVALGLFVVDLAVMSVGADHTPVLIATVIVSGIFIGINNTLTTQAVMLVAPVERPVASAAYGFVRFLGGGLAPCAAGKLAEHFGLLVPFAVGAVAVLAGVLVLSSARGMLARADAGLDEDGDGVTAHGAPSVAGEMADEFGGAPAAIEDELQVEERARNSAAVPF